MAGTRAFIAIEVDKALKPAINAVLQELKAMDCVTTTSSDNLHFTLFFFDSLNDNEINLVKAAMRIAARESFRLKLKGINFFMHRNDPQVVYIGIESSDALVRLYSTLNSALRQAGFDIDQRPFSPHLTMGRVKSLSNPVKREALLSLRSKYSGKEFGSFTCRSLTLKKSVLTQTGPVHEDMYKVDLANMLTGCVPAGKLLSEMLLM